MNDDRNGPWIYASHCVFGGTGPYGQLNRVRCPGMMCGITVKLSGGVIPAHDNPLTFHPCSWSGVVIVNDLEKIDS